jgi:hypothetical protein
VPGDRSLLGDADRDRLVAVLREHYAAGRLEMPEFDRRAGIVLAASYADEAAAALDGLPPMAAPGAPGAAARPRSRKRHAQVNEPQPGWVPPPNASATRPATRSCGSGPTRPTAAATTSRTPVPSDGTV